MSVDSININPMMHFVVCRAATVYEQDTTLLNSREASLLQSHKQDGRMSGNKIDSWLMLYLVHNHSIMVECIATPIRQYQ